MAVFIGDSHRTEKDDPLEAAVLSLLQRAQSFGQFDLESTHRLLDAYLWLALKFPATFVQPDAAAALQLSASLCISEALETLPPPPPRRAGRGFAAARQLAREPRPARPPYGKMAKPPTQKKLQRRASRRKAKRERVPFFDEEGGDEAATKLQQRNSAGDAS